MPNNPVGSPIAMIAINDSKLPIYRFSHIEYALPLASALNVLNLEGSSSSEEIQSFISVHTRRFLNNQYISLEAFIHLIHDLAQEGQNFKAETILRNLIVQSLQDRCQKAFESHLDSTSNETTSIEADTNLTTLDLLPSILDDKETLPKFITENDESQSDVHTHQSYSDQIKARNQTLLSLLDDWDQNPDYELDNTWDEVMINL